MDVQLISQVMQIGIGAVTLVILWQLWLSYKELQNRLFTILDRLAQVQENQTRLIQQGVDAKADRDRG